MAKPVVVDEVAEQAAPVEDLSHVPADVSLSADEFFIAYERDLDRAFRDYGGKVIELTGVVDLFGRSIYGGVFIKMDVSDHLLSGNLGSAYPEPWAIVARGQTIRVRGRWSQKLSRQGIQFVVVETDTRKRIPVTVDEVVRAFTQDPRAASDHYRGKYVSLSGTIADLDFDDSDVGANQVKVVLKGDGKLKLNCCFDADERERLRGVAIGQTIRLVGDNPFVWEGRLLLPGCYLVSSDPPAVPVNPALDRPLDVDE
jgi:hypothetical protein